MSFIFLSLRGTSSVEEALQQIEQKQYAAPYSADPRKVVKVRVSFSSEMRNIVDWKAVE